MELLSRPIGPLATNVYVLADPASREALAIDTAIPCLDWLSGVLTERGWRLKLIVSTHGHWDHTGDNAAVQAWSREQAAHLAEHQADHSADGGAPIAVHPLDRDMLVAPQPLFAPFEIPPSVPAVELAEGGLIKFGEIELSVLHTPGHTQGSVCLLERGSGLLLSGDTLFAGGWGRTDLPGGSAEQIAESLGRLCSLEDRVRVLPGHGAADDGRRGTRLAGGRQAFGPVAVLALADVRPGQSGLGQDPAGHRPLKVRFGGRHAEGQRRRERIQSEAVAMDAAGRARSAVPRPAEIVATLQRVRVGMKPFAQTAGGPPADIEDDPVDEAPGIRVVHDQGIRHGAFGPAVPVEGGGHVLPVAGVDGWDGPILLETGTREDETRHGCLLRFAMASSWSPRRHSYLAPTGARKAILNSSTD